MRIPMGFIPRRAFSAGGVVLVVAALSLPDISRAGDAAPQPLSPHSQQSSGHVVIDRLGVRATAPTRIYVSEKAHHHTTGQFALRYSTTGPATFLFPHRSHSVVASTVGVSVQRWSGKDHRWEPFVHPGATSLDGLTSTAPVHGRVRVAVSMRPGGGGRFRALFTFTARLRNGLTRERTVDSGAFDVHGARKLRSCSKEVPDGAWVDIHGDIHQDGKVLEVPCQYGGVVPGIAKVVPSYRVGRDGWWVASMFNNRDLSRISAYYKVPNAPRKTGAINFFFPSLQTSEPRIVQPVLEYGPNGAYPSRSGNYWIIVSWTAGRKDSRHSTPQRVSPGDIIHGTASKVNMKCVSNCSWDVVTKDVTTGASTRLRALVPGRISNAQGGVMENYFASTCNQLPASGNIRFYSIVLKGARGLTLRPSFQKWFPHRGCAAGVPTASATTTKLTWHASAR